MENKKRFYWKGTGAHGMDGRTLIKMVGDKVIQVTEYGEFYLNHALIQSIENYLTENGYEEVHWSEVESEEETPNKNTEPNPYDSVKNLMRIGQPRIPVNVECDGDLCRLVPTEPEPEESDT